ncbi:hypothetical protein QRX60_32710 [Amycolatopsis mongoliensis]|uniref:Amidohydrolase n=1 Tax=Amycolatopsis mongoliensis TaxID=715475 RepID=A0A9Y2JJV2_9PSEU|nr:hypothetical protein [Amycolatopsis sp. 4-36]WIX98805.1 hypothetical protein QRX60_32710 [Amycolatopsis sp. 4-36]
MRGSRVIFTGGRVFDGTGSAAVPGDVVVRGDRIEAVRSGVDPEPGDRVVDCRGATVLRDCNAAGLAVGPRMRAASFERDNNPVQLGGLG